MDGTEIDDHGRRGTEVEVKEKKDRVADATHATRAAVSRCSMLPVGIVNLTRSTRPSWPLSLERGQPYRRAKDFSAPNRRPPTAGEYHSCLS
jgi:hypothetical protein